MAGANKPDGKNPQQRVAFTRRDADRIARTVRIVEGGDKKGNALTFGNRIRPTIAVTGTTATSTLTTASITVLTGAVLSTASLTFTRADVVVVSTATASSQSLDVYNCPSNAVSAESQAFFFG